jgi:hypothetical protein
MNTIYKILDNSIYIITVSYITWYVIRYYTQKLGSIDTDQLNQDLFIIAYTRKNHGKLLHR